jgi:dynamin 1-like protein
VKDFHNYEVNKYMQKDIQPIRMPRMAAFKRAEDNDPGQSSPRASMEASLIKNLIVSYFDTVRKSMNDMVPKTIMAFLVNKSKNNAQRVLVQQIYNDGQHLDQFLSEDHETRLKREKCEAMVKTLK